jgi:type IV secretory pathway VirJ component
VICVYGRGETDSLCPLLAGAAARTVGLPGNHHLDHDRARVIATTLTALHDLAPRTGL